MANGICRSSELVGINTETCKQTAVNKQEIVQLMREHEAIRVHMNFITKSFKNVATESGRAIARSIRLHDLLRFYLWPLYDFREALHRHFSLDERIFMCFGNPVKDIMAEHEVIRKQADNIIQLAENAVYGKLCQEELNQSTINIRETFNKICGSVEAHTAKEDRLLR
jgi:hypothetical protein